MLAASAVAVTFLPAKLSAQDNTWNTTGNIGIGTGSTAPSVKLDVRGGSGDIFRWGTVNDDYYGILGYNTSTSRVYLTTRGAKPSALVLGPNGREDLFINAAGGVGIGAMNGSNYRLDVAGDQRVSGSFVSSIYRDIGGEIGIENPMKTDPGMGKIWRIYNTTGSTYGNALQFWAYDEKGCAGGALCAPRLILMDDGNVGIGVTNPTYKLTVEGTIGARKIKVTQQANWADFVFEPNYKLPSLQEVESYIKANGHLQDIPTAAEVQKDGVDLADMNKKLLQKVEELTLYIIELKKEVDQLKIEKADKQ